MLLITMVYFYQLIQVVHGRNLIPYGRENIFNKPHGPLQLMRSSYSVLDVYIVHLLLHNQNLQEFLQGKLVCILRDPIVRNGFS